MALLDRPGAYRALNRFAAGLAAAVGAAHILLSFTPLSGLYFQHISALPPALAEMARLAFIVALPLGPLAVYQNWFQGTILYDKHTRGVPESVAVFFAVILTVLGGGLALGSVTGLFVNIAGFTLANAAQAAWLGFRARPVHNRLQESAQ